MERKYWAICCVLLSLAWQAAPSAFGAAPFASRRGPAQIKARVPTWPIVRRQPPDDPATLEPPVSKPLTIEDLGEPKSIDPAADDVKPIGQVLTNIRPHGGIVPRDQPIPGMPALPLDGGATSRGWLASQYNYQATAFCHPGLHFEEVNLERHGYSFGVFQPVVSTAAFFGTIPILPYKLVAEPCRDCVYTLGHYRPGSYAPFRRNRVPIRADATLLEMGLITGVVFMVP